MFRVLRMAFLAGVLGALAVATEAAPPAVVTNAEFVKRAALSDIFETKISELAAIKGDGDTRAFATKMNEAHQKTSSELGVLVKGRAADLPLPARLDFGRQRQVDAMAELDGDSFKINFVRAQIRAHEAAVKLFDSFTRSGPPGPIRDWAAETLPKLQEHLQASKVLAE